MDLLLGLRAVLCGDLSHSCSSRLYTDLPSLSQIQSDDLVKFDLPIMENRSPRGGLSEKYWLHQVYVGCAHLPFATLTDPSMLRLSPIISAPSTRPKMSKDIQTRDLPPSCSRMKRWPSQAVGVA